MNLEKPLQAVSAAIAEAGKQALPAAGARWHVLFDGRQRPLLMPSGEYRLQKQWLPYFVGSRRKSLYARALLKLNSLAPGVGLLPEFQLPFATDAGLYGVPLASPAAIQIGTTGPYQKASALLTSERGEGIALAKIALVPSADVMVTKEASWLRQLEGMPELASQVPRLLAEGETPEGRRYLVTTLAPSTRATAAFTPTHARFLGLLAHSRAETFRFTSSPCRDTLERMLAEIDPLLAREDAARLRGALDDCRNALARFVGPFVLSQGDFAWWNIRVHGGGLFVFDWEYAHRGANPLADLFHYHLIQRAAAGRRIGSWSLMTVMNRARHFAQHIHPEREWRAHEITALALAYVLDVLLRYSRASAGLDRAEHVIQGYWSLMERRSTWMA